MVVGGLIIAVAFFFIGSAYGKSHAPQPVRGGFGGQAGMMHGGGRQSGGFVNGSILSMDATSITVSTGGGTGTKIIYFNPATAVLKSVAGTATDLSVGETIVATGTPNADGSIAAQSIQIRPAMQKPVTPAGS